MDIWHSWTALLADSLHWISSHWGVHEATAVILLTLLVRLALMPISWRAAVSMEDNKRKMKLLKPQLDALKALHGDNKAALSAETMQLYRESGVSLMDRMTLANITTQGVFGIGLFQVLGKASITSKFLWIANLAKPDLWLSALIVVLMLLSMALMPGAAADPSLWVAMAVSILAVGVMIFAVPSTVGIYWATSSAVGLAQTLALRAFVNRRPESLA